MMPVEVAVEESEATAKLNSWVLPGASSCGSKEKCLNFTKNLQNWLKGFPFASFQRCIKWSIAALVLLSLELKRTFCKQHRPTEGTHTCPRTRDNGPGTWLFLCLSEPQQGQNNVLLAKGSFFTFDGRLRNPLYGIKQALIFFVIFNQEHLVRQTSPR